MEIPERLWEIILWDFIIKLLKSKDPVTGQEYNNILVVVDKLTKWGYFILCTKEMSMEDLLKVYVKKMFIKHKILMKIISNWDLRFISAFWETFIVSQK